MSSSTDKKNFAPGRPLCFMVAVWGEPYCRPLVDLCLPSLLAPDNLPLLDAAAGHRLLIATTKEDWQRIEHLPVMERLRRHVVPTLIEVGLPDGPGYAGVLRHQTHCQKLLVEAGYSYSSYGCLLWPDVIFSNGLVAALLRSIERGDHLLLLPALRQVEETVLEELAARGLLPTDQPLSVSADALTLAPRLVAELAIRHLHPEIEAFAEGKRVEGQRPQITRPPFRFWRVADGRGIILHIFFAVPALMDFAAVSPDHTACLEHGDFERVYVEQNFSSCGGVSAVVDSDECGVLSLTPGSVDRTPSGKVFERVGARLMPSLALLADVRDSMRSYAQDGRNVGRDLFRRSVRWHVADVDDAWLQEEARIDRIITRATSDFYADPSPRPTRLSRAALHGLLDLVIILQRYVYSLNIVFAALAGDAEQRLVVRRKLSALTSRYLAPRKR